VPGAPAGARGGETGGRDRATRAVRGAVKRARGLLKAESFDHSCPHGWRSETRLVFRALDQWFVGVDRGGLGRQALAAVGAVKWIPASGENRIRAALEGRPTGSCRVSAPGAFRLRFS